MRIKEILHEGESIIPQPSALKVDISAYNFNSLMKEFRGGTSLETKGDSGLVMFYSDYERNEFVNFLTSKNIDFKDIESEKQHPSGENTTSPVAKRKANRFGV